MKSLNFLYAILLTLSLHSSGSDAAQGQRKQSNTVLLSNIKAITLRKDLRTSHRRVPAVPQLKCVGGNAKGFYEVDVMRCHNQGIDYDEESVQWACTASLPPEFKLGSTDVVCEGYTGPNDPYVLKGSCGVEYRLMLTPSGEERYGRKKPSSKSKPKPPPVVSEDEIDDEYSDFADPIEGHDDFPEPPPPGRKSPNLQGASKHTTWSGLMFWGAFISILGYILYTAMFRIRGPATDGGRELPKSPWGWGGGGPNGDPAPPPYDFYSKGPQTPRTPSAWRPGFWSGVLGGGAAGYMANKGQQAPAAAASEAKGASKRDEKSSNGEGSSSGATATSSSRYEGTGFGSTTRR